VLYLLYPSRTRALLSVLKTHDGEGGATDHHHEPLPVYDAVPCASCETSGRSCRSGRSVGPPREALPPAPWRPRREPRRCGARTPKRARWSPTEDERRPGSRPYPCGRARPIPVSAVVPAPSRLRARKPLAQSTPASKTSAPRPRLASPPPQAKACIRRGCRAHLRPRRRGNLSR
jgi:hypothetical protein